VGGGAFLVQFPGLDLWREPYLAALPERRPQLFTVIRPNGDVVSG
jgi:hypothetical protein